MEGEEDVELLFVPVHLQHRLQLLLGWDQRIHLIRDEIEMVNIGYSQFTRFYSTHYPRLDGIDFGHMMNAEIWIN